MTYRGTEDPVIRRLADLRLRPRRDPEFRRRVWARINERVAPTNWFRYVRTHMLTVSTALAIALLVGAIAGLERARAQDAQDNKVLAKSYVRALDPRMRTP